MSRRTFIRLGMLTAAAVPLAVACAPQAPTAKPTAAPAKPAEAAKPAAAAPTSAPAAAKPAEAAKPAPAAPTAAPAAAKPAEAAKPSAAAPAAGASAKPGQHLIGKLEGSVVVLDPAQTPKAFKEAPMLAEMVKAGKLPPVEQRLPSEPLVVKPLHSTGKYGGTWRRGFTGPGDTSNAHRAAQNDKLLYFDFTGTKIVPNIAKGYEVSSDGKVTTLTLRKGHKWSDGHPFTADDFVFWYEDVYQNKDLVGTPLLSMTINGKPVAIEKGDEVTVRFVSPEPYYALPNVLAAVLQLGHHARFGRDAWGGYAPAHYLKQFLPKYTPQADLDKRAADEKFDNWSTMFKIKNDSTRNPELPTLAPWMVTSPITTPNFVLERNPYSIWVDTDGNQLPYIDKIQMSLAENLEVLNLRAIAGEYDEQARHIDISKLPVLLDNQQKGNYTIRLDPSAQGADVGMFCNQSFDKDPEIAKWLNNREFRIALSHGFERAQINETFVLGLGQTGSAAPGEDTLFFPGKEFLTLHSEFDQKKSNELLDKIGLTKKDGEGYRLRTDNGQRLRIELTTYIGFLPFTRMAEMITQQWKQIGIQGDVLEQERSLTVRRVQGNEHQIYFDTQWGTDNIYGHTPMFFPFDKGSPTGPLHGIWFSSAGTQGKEPAPRMRELMDKYRKGFGVPDEERIKLGKEAVGISLDELWIIPVVSNSPASQGVRVVKNNVGNVPERQWNSAVSDNPMIAHPETYFFKS
ncbi:MAG: ABC transporter substrate-binding protein [Chloroflexota bacterium]